jgi:hypothetical protein
MGSMQKRFRRKRFARKSSKPYLFEAKGNKFNDEL